MDSTLTRELVFREKHKQNHKSKVYSSKICQIYLFLYLLNSYYIHFLQHLNCFFFFSILSSIKNKTPSSRFMSIIHIHGCYYTQNVYYKS